MIGKAMLTFLAGFASIAFPCVLPLVPGYLATVSAVETSRLGQPGTARRVVIASLFRAGADVFRINMSHTSDDRMRELMAAIRAVEFEYGRPIGVLVDLQGPKLRVGTFAGGPVTLTKDASFQLDSNPALDRFADTLEKVCVDTVEDGYMTKDLALLVGDHQGWLTTEGFIDKVAEHLQAALAA